MRGNTFGKMLSITSFGESHGKAMGVVIDGMPAGLSFSLSDLQKELDRRAPGRRPGTTTRKEEDRPSIFSGIFQGKTLGTPIAVLVENKNQQSEDYRPFQSVLRPGHADQTTLQKYGIRDYRGGGRASGRETLSRVIGGYFASLVIPDIKALAWPISFGPHLFSHALPGKGEEWGEGGPKEAQVTDYLLTLQKKGESCGGRVGLLIQNVPAGLGDPVFHKLKSDLASAFLSIGGVVSFSYGLGEEMASLLGSEVSKERSYFGGIEGGISNGEEMRMTLTFKPPSTVGKMAQMGRHDPCLIPRALPVIESMAKLVLADHFLCQEAYGLWEGKSKIEKY